MTRGNSSPILQDYTSKSVEKVRGHSIREEIAHGKLTLIKAVYRLESGEVVRLT